MSRPTDLELVHVPGDAGAAGFAHGRAIRALLEPAFLEAYVARLGEATGTHRDDLRAQASRWRANLPERFQEEIAAMGEGAGVATAAVAELLYADIARPTVHDMGKCEDPVRGTESCPRVASPEAVVMRGADENEAVGDAPMCSAVIARLDDAATWIGRNCDWLVPTLMRGTAAVVHETPHRIPIMAVGIRGDIDVDTGLNAEGLWLHLHTLFAGDDPPRDRTCISWLFWAREALETCATLDELERFIAATGRDRGVLAIAGEGRTDRAAVFECTRAGHVRHDLDAAGARCVTNHSPAKRYDEASAARSRPGGTVGRQRALHAGVRARPPRTGPDDLVTLLAHPEVEMRTPRWLRTIYAAVVRPRDASIWFAAGDADGTPAASSGRWQRVHTPW